MINLRSFKREEPGVYPSHWPTADYEMVTTRLLCNLPDKIGIQNYSYVRRVNQQSSVATVVVDPQSNILFYPCATDADTAVFKKWLDANIATIKELASKGFQGTLVGKMLPESPARFGVYYVIERKLTIWLDSISIKRVLKLAQSPLGETMFVLPESPEFAINVHKPAHVVSAPALDEVSYGEHSVCFPIEKSERRDSITLPPRITSHPILMGFAAFHHTSHQLDDADALPML